MFAVRSVLYSVIVGKLPKRTPPCTCVGASHILITRLCTALLLILSHLNLHRVSFRCHTNTLTNNLVTLCAGMKVKAPKVTCRRLQAKITKLEKTNEEYRLKGIMFEQLKKVYIRGHAKDSRLRKFLRENKWYSKQASLRLANNRNCFEWLSRTELGLLRLSKARTDKLASDIRSRWKRRKTSANRSLHVFTHCSGPLKGERGVRVRPNSVGVQKGSLLLVYFKSRQRLQNPLHGRSQLTHSPGYLE